MADESGSDNSDSDWLFVSPEDIEIENVPDETLTKELIEDDGVYMEKCDESANDHKSDGDPGTTTLDPPNDNVDDLKNGQNCFPDNKVNYPEKKNEKAEDFPERNEKPEDFQNENEMVPNFQNEDKTLQDFKDDGEKNLQVVNKNEDLQVLNKNEDLQVLNKNEDLQVVNKNEDLQVVNKNEDLQVVNKNEDLQVVNKNEDQVVNKNEDQVVNKNEDQVVNKNEDQVVNKNEDLQVVNKNEDLQVVNKNEDLQVVNKNEDLQVVNKNENLQVVNKNENLQDVNKNESLQSCPPGIVMPEDRQDDTAGCDTDSSSDVDILDESVGASDSSNPLATNPLLPTSLVLSTAGLLADADSTTSCIPLPRVPSVTDQGTQTPRLVRANAIRRRPPISASRPWSLQDWAYELWCIWVRWGMGAFILVYLAVIILVLNHLLRPFCLTRSLYEVQDTLAQCFGEQQIVAMSTGDTEMLNISVCTHKVEEYKVSLRNALSWRAKRYLVAAVNNPDDPDFLSFKTFYEDIYMDVIIRHLQFFDLLPIKEENTAALNDIQDLRDEVKREIPSDTVGDNSILNNQTSKDEVVLDGLDQNKTRLGNDDLIVAKDGIHREMESEDIKSDDSNIKELKRKVTWLVMENQKLQRKIEHLAQSGSYCTKNYKEVTDANFTTHGRPSNESIKNSNQKHDTDDKIKPYLDEVVSSLSSQIVNLQNSLADELKEVKKWNELLQNMTMEIRHKPIEQTEEDSWSWQDIRENVENIVTEVHEDLKEKLNVFQTLNISDTFHSVVEDNKKNAEYMLNLVNHYYNVAKNRTQEMMQDTKEPQTDSEADTKGFWSEFQDHWDYLRGRVKETTDNQEQSKNDDEKESSVDVEPEDVIENWYIKKLEAGHENSYDEKSQKNVYKEGKKVEENWYFKKRQPNYASPYEKHTRNDWLFKRAEYRAKRRRQQAKARSHSRAQY